MYQSFFGLRERPFDLTPNPRFLVLTDAHREAMSNLEYAIASRRGIMALIGDAGTGKTTLIRAAIERQPTHVHTVYINNPALTRAEFVETLAASFELSADARSSKATLLQELEARLRQHSDCGEANALIIDEAQSLPLELLEEIRLLGNIETSETKLLSIILAGQPELAARLNEDSLRQLKQRVALRCELPTLTQNEAAAYLAGRIRAAGGVGAQVFTREAVMLIHERARGIPRTISVIADNALLTAFALRVKPVTTQIVTEVCQDLDLDAGVDAPAPSTPPAIAELPPEPIVALKPALLTFETPATERARVAPHGSSVPKQDNNQVQDEAQATDPRDSAVATSSSSDGGMFTNMYSKRRRFSIFRGQ